MHTRLVLTAKAILTQHRSKPVIDGFVLVGGNRILQVGERRDLQFLPSVRLLDLGDTVLLPGLINAHCHLDFTSLKGRVPHRGNFREWLTAMAGRTRRTTAAEFKKSIQAGVRESLAYGTTTLCDISTSYESYGILKRQTLLRAKVFFECLDFGKQSAFAAWKRALERIRHHTALPPHPSTLQWGLALHSPFTVSPEFFYLTGRLLDRHRRIPTTLHLGESREEWEYFAHRRGPVENRMKQLGITWPKPDARTPIKFVARRGWLPKLDLAVHCNTVDAKDMELLARHRVAVVHCPGSHDYFDHPKFRYEEMRRKRIRVCLGTDSLASNRSLSMFREMRLFRKNHPSVSASETLSLATNRAAQALGMGKDIGQVRPGYLADIIGVPAPARGFKDTEALSDWVLRHKGEVSFSMVNGETRLRLAGSRMNR